MDRFGVDFKWLLDRFVDDFSSICCHYESNLEGKGEGMFPAPFLSPTAVLAQAQKIDVLAALPPLGTILRQDVPQGPRMLPGGARGPHKAV